MSSKKDKTPQEMARLMIYDDETGILTWRERSAESFNCAVKERGRVASRWNLLRAGKRAGCINPLGRRVITIEKRTYFASRVAWAIYFGAWPEGVVDHINHDVSDDSIKNLRDVSYAENAQNTKLSSRNSSGRMGVHFHAGHSRWRAKISHLGQDYYLGSFTTKEAATRARAAAEKELGFHENHGGEF